MKSRQRFRNYHPLRRNQWRRLIPLLLLASCVTMGGLGTSGCTPLTVVKTDFCTGWKPILASKADVLTDGTAKQILAHDQHGVDMKCWPAPTRKSGKPDSEPPAALTH